MKKTLSIAAAIITSAFTIGAANAQDISTYYTVQNADKFEIDWAAVYNRGTEMTHETRATLPHKLDLAYGQDIKQRLDIYMPKTKVKNAPVLLFLHGGGFREGDRLHYGYIAEPFAKHGIITAVASYRLTPAGHKYPSQAEDAKNVVIWLAKNIAQYGGNPKAIFITGHSAGAILTADIGVDRNWLKDAGLSPDIIKGIAPVSGRYNILQRDLDDYAPTPELKRQASAVYHVFNPPPEVIIAYGTREDSYRLPSEELNTKLLENKIKSEVLVLHGEDHKDTVLSLGKEESVLFNRVLKMIKDAK